MKKLSVVLATYNEEKNLRDTLKTAENFANEIIIVDGGSTDKTVAIAKEFGARVVVTTNPQIFHINKQKAIDMATKDWVLQLDADEHVSHELKEEIKKILKEDDTDVNGYWMPRKNYFLGRFLMKGGQYPDYTLRLYRRGKGYLPQKTVHEQAVVDGETRYLTSPLLHMSDREFSRYYMRWNRYTDHIANEFEEQHLGINLFSFVKYMFVLPLWWFLLTYIRHKGFMDSWQGFVFSFFSALRFPVGYYKYVRNK